MIFIGSVPASGSFLRQFTINELGLGVEAIAVDMQAIYFTTGIFGPRLSAANPSSVLLLDEPTASLDALNTRQIEELVTLWLAGAPDRSAIWTSHQREQVQRMTTDQLELPAFA